MKSRRFVTAAVAFLVVSALVGGTWFLARQVQSPSQREAAAAAPSLAPITVTARRSSLVDQITATGSLATDQTTTISIPLAGGTSVVTDNPVAVGETLHPGSCVLRVNGRPLIALTGAFPAYRDLVEGDEGDDVRQLQQALTDLGYSLTPDGAFGPATTRAVTSLYRSLGFTVPTTSGARTLDTKQDTKVEAGDAPQDDQAASVQTSPRDVDQRRVTLPRSEVVYVPRAVETSTVTAIPTVGAVLTDATASITLAAGRTRLKVEVPQATAQSLEIGATASVTIAGEQYSLVLESTQSPQDSPAPGSTDADPAGNSTDSQGTSASGAGGAGFVSSSYTLMFSADPELPADVASTEALVVTIDRTVPIDDAIVVPKRAVASTPDGKHTVLRQDSSGGFTAVEVELLGCVGGQCALGDGAVADGDLLRVDGS